MNIFKKKIKVNIDSAYFLEINLGYREAGINYNTYKKEDKRLLGLICLHKNQSEYVSRVISNVFLVDNEILTRYSDKKLNLFIEKEFTKDNIVEKIENENIKEIIQSLDIDKIKEYILGIRK